LRLPLATAALTVALTLGLAVAATSAANKPIKGMLVVVPKPSEPLEITLHHSGGALVGEVPLLVRNTAAVTGTLRVRFFSKKSGKYTNLSTASNGRPPTDLPLITDETANPTVFGRRQTRLVQLRFTLAAHARAEAVDGVLVLRLKPAHTSAVDSLVLTTVGRLATTATPGTEKPQPATATLQVTSLFPFRRSILWGEHQRVFVPAHIDDDIDRRQVVTLASAGSLLRVTLSAEHEREGAADGLTRASILVDKVGSPGKYTGDLVLGPQSSEKLPVTVHVRDFFFWPLLVLALGAALGGFGTRWWEGRRRRALLLKRAKEAYDVYAAFAKHRPPDRPPLPLDPTPEARYKDLAAAIKKATDEDGYNEQVDAVAAFERDLRQWLRLATAADGLEGFSEPGTLWADVEMLREWLRVPVFDEHQSQVLVEQAERLARIVHSFLEVKQVWEEHGQPGELDPSNIYRRGAYISDAAELRVRRDYEARRDEIVRQTAAEGLTIDSLTVQRLFAFGDARRVVRAFFPTGFPSWKSFEGLPPSAIERHVRRFDWVVASASALVTLLAFLLTKYGQDYGTLSDYALAFTAGFVGQLAGAAIAWNLFPPFRSYRATKTPSTSSTPAAS
jgi:hypothetical protein